MVLYPAHLVGSPGVGGTLSSQLEMLLAKMVCVIAEVPSISESRNKTLASATADLEDIRQSQQGDNEAYRRLIERHQEHVGRILWRFTRDRQVHEELVQDAFVEAYLSLASYRGKAPLAHWLSRIATRVGYRYWKQTAHRQRQERFSLQEWDKIADETTEQTDPSRAAALVHQMLAQLPPRDRLVLTLRYLEECDVAETARRTGWTKTMVKVQASRARKKLEKLFVQSGKEIAS
jgi:RNA polymerase sigma-70 factor (ECF subfamily)